MQNNDVSPVRFAIGIKRRQRRNEEEIKRGGRVSSRESDLVSQFSNNSLRTRRRRIAISRPLFARSFFLERNIKRTPWVRPTPVSHIGIVSPWYCYLFPRNSPITDTISVLFYLYSAFDDHPIDYSIFFQLTKISALNDQIQASGRPPIIRRVFRETNAINLTISLWNTERTTGKV